MIRIRLGAAAKKDIREAKEWYVEQKPGLDLKFRDELERTLGRIRSFPESYPMVYKDVRRANLRRFPYAVFYHERQDGFFVLAVIHQARHPNHWQMRR